MGSVGIDEKLPRWAMAIEGLPLLQVQRIDSHFTERAYEPGSNVFRQADRGETFFVVVTGQVRLSHTNVEGKEYVSGIWSTDYPLGLVSAVLGQRRIQSVQAINQVILRTMNCNDLIDLMAELPQFSINMSRLLASMARYSIARSGPLALDSSAGRLARVLVRLAADNDVGKDADGLKRTVSGVRQDDLAMMVGASRPWVSLTLGSFERQGLISRGRGRIVINDIGTFERVFRS